MATYTNIKKAFFALSPKEQEAMFKEIYGFSKDMKSFLDIRLVGDGEEEYIKQIKKASESVTSKGTPKTIQVQKVNAILTKAKKSKVSKKTLCEMEWIAFDGYVTFLDDYGDGPEIYYDKVYSHLENYLFLISKIYTAQEEEKKIEEVKIYIKKHKNMYCDGLWELLEDDI